jgi:transposase
VVDAVQARLDKNPDAMRTRRETVEHPFGTLKMRMGATHFLTKTLLIRKLNRMIAALKPI